MKENMAKKRLKKRKEESKKEWKRKENKREHEAKMKPPVSYVVICNGTSSYDEKVKIFTTTSL